MFVSYCNNILRHLVGEKSLIIWNIALEGSKTEKKNSKSKSLMPVLKISSQKYVP